MVVLVFLRALEYYRGILLLTSNCVRKFDEAVTSRISLVIPFRSLQSHERERLRLKYTNTILQDPQQRYSLFPDAHDALERIDKSPYTFNGREIKTGNVKPMRSHCLNKSNLRLLVFHMTLRLATEDAKNATNIVRSHITTEASQLIKVKAQHVTSVMKYLEQFEDYQRGEFGKDRETLAFEEERRNRT